MYASLATDRRHRQAGSGEVWRFEENDPNTWDKIPRGRQALSLVRQEK